MEKDKKDSVSDEFMLSYFPTTYQRHFYERESSEKSFNAFLTLASAIIGGTLVLISSLGATTNTYIMASVALLIVLLIGYVIFERICSRTITSIRWIMRANLALSYFTDQNKQLENYIKSHRINEVSENRWESFRLKGGGLARLSATINTIQVIGVAVILSKYIWNLSTITSLAFVVFMGLLVWLIHVATWRRKILKLREVVAPTFQKNNKKKTK